MNQVLMWIDLIAALYMLWLSAMMKTSGAWSTFVFKVVPFLIGLLLAFIASQEAGMVVTFGS